MDIELFPAVIKLGEYDFKFLTELEVERDYNGNVKTITTEDIIGPYENIDNYYQGIFCTINNYETDKIMKKNNINSDFAGYYFLVTNNKKLLNGISSSDKSIIKNINNIVRHKGISGIRNGKNGLSSGNPTYSKLNILTCMMKCNNQKVAVYTCKEKNQNISIMKNIKKNLEYELIKKGYEKVEYDLNHRDDEKFNIKKQAGNNEVENKLENIKQIENINNYPKHYQWIEFFEKLTNKILDYKNNKVEFENKVINAIGEYSKIGNYKKSGIDPLSFIYDLARLWKRKDKLEIYTKVCNEFNIDINLSTINEWVFINPIYNTFFYYGNELESNNIHWDIFSMAKSKDFIKEEIFNEILKIKNISIAKLTQVLSIINPETYTIYDTKAAQYSNLENVKNSNRTFNIYKQHQEKLRELFPHCKTYEINTFIKLNASTEINYNKRKVYQISSYMRDGETNKSDHLEKFIIESAVYVDSETTSTGIPYPINNPNKHDIIVARYGNTVNAIGVVIKNEYKKGYSLENKINVVWINKHRAENILIKPQDIALKEMTETDLERCKKIYEETFKMMNLFNNANRKITELLKFKKQIILQGAPGTGKTYTAKKVAEEMGIGYEVIQFHPSYTYEDFVRGISAKSENGNISYEIEDKILMNAVKEAEDKPYILIIDEINRANLPSVLGELLYALEYRGEAVKCPYGESIIIPENLYIIGTMNTADRSIGSIDYAIRRRFAFYTIISNKEIIEDEEAQKLYDSIYNIIKTHISDEYHIDDIMVGHSYFLPKEDNDYNGNYLELSLHYNIIPLLMEYYKDGILIDKDNIEKNDNNSVLNKIKNLNNYFNSEE